MLIFEEILHFTPLLVIALLWIAPCNLILRAKVRKKNEGCGATLKKLSFFL